MALHIIRGTAAPTSVPTEIGQHFVDTTNGTQYLSTGTASSTDWKRVDNSGSGVTDFLGLTDSPANYVGAGSKAVKVNAGATGLEFVTDDTFDDLSPLTTGGDLLYGAGSGAGTRLANGSAGQVLTSAGTTLPPTWAAAAGGGGTTVEVTASDTTPGNLDDKIVAGLGVEKTVLSPGGDEDLQIKMSDPYLAIQSTGLLSGGLLSVGGTTGTFDIAIGTGVYVANSASPPVTIQDVSISARTNEAVTDIATQLVTYIQIDKDDNIIQTGTFPTAANRRDNIFLGVVVHSDNVNVLVVNNLQSTAYDTTAQMHDISNALGFFNLAGNVISPNGVNLNLNKSAGSGFKDGANFENNRKDPSTLTLAGLVALTFRYRNQDSTEGSNVTLFDPTTYDNGGTTTTIPANNNATIQRIYIFPSNIIRLQRGQQVFATFSAALDAVGKEPFVTEQNISENGLLLASIVTKKNTSDLSDISESLIFTATRFGELGSVGSSSIGTLQQTYLNSISPQITTTLGAMNFKAGETDPDIVVEITNAADATVASITGEGDLVAADVSATGAVTGSNLSGTNTGDVDFDDLSPMTTGADLIYGGASGTGTRLANGTVGQVLTSSGTTVAPTWATPAGGAAGLGDGGGTGAMISQNITGATDGTAAGATAIAIGPNPSAAGGSSVALGNQSSAAGTNCIAIGYLASAASFNSVSIGGVTIAKDRSVAIGAGAETGFNSVAIGLDSGDDLSTSSVSVGTQAGEFTTSNRNVNLGHQAGRGASGEDCIYIGHTCGTSNAVHDRFIIENTSDITTPLIDGKFGSGGGTRPEFIKINGRFQTKWVSATAAFTAMAGDKILADTATTAAFTVTLPVGVDGDEVSFADSKNNWGTDNLTIARAGSDTIIGGATTLVLSTNDAAVKLVFFGTEWITAP